MSDYEQFSELKRLCGAFLLLSLVCLFVWFCVFTSFLLLSVFLLQILSHER